MLGPFPWVLWGAGVALGLLELLDLLFGRAARGMRILERAFAAQRGVAALARTDSVLTQLAVERAPVDTEQASRSPVVPPGALEHLLNVAALHRR